MKQSHNDIQTNTHKTSAFKTTTFSTLAKQSIYGVCLNIKEHVMATHRELAILRRCAKSLCAEPQQVVHVVAPEQQQQARFIANTLMHFGVSCGQIVLNYSQQKTHVPKGVWLLVADK